MYESKQQLTDAVRAISYMNAFPCAALISSVARIQHHYYIKSEIMIYKLLSGIDAAMQDASCDRYISTNGKFLAFEKHYVSNKPYL